MPKFTINPDGSIETDTPEAALAMARLMMAQPKPREAPAVGRAPLVSQPSPKPPRRAEPKALAESEIETEADEGDVDVADDDILEPQNEETVVTWKRFVGFLGDPQRTTLQTIKDHDVITLDDLTRILNVEKTSVAGYFSGIIKNAKKGRIRLSDVFRRSEQGYGRKRVIRYKAGALLRDNDVTE